MIVVYAVSRNIQTPQNLFDHPSLFQNGGQFIIILFACLLALFASFSLQNSFVFYTCWRGREG